ncbi:Cullin-domain-containing protein [Lichtheimia hyalospora FSU 10163]|nr:Cullin-domain-containing protein [Lichtheimia hyalospora FSU 10163]
MSSSEWKITKKRKASFSNTQSPFDSDHYSAGLAAKISREEQSSKATTCTTPMVLDTEKTATATRVLGTLRLRPAKQVSFHLKDPQSHWMMDPYLEQVWDQLRQVLNMIFQKETLNMSLQCAYEACMLLCQNNKAQHVFGRLKTELSTHIQQSASMLSGLRGEKYQLMELVSQQWQVLCTELALIRNIFIELDRRYVIRETSFASIIDFGQHLFRELIMDRTDIREPVIDGLIDMIEKERNGQSVDRKLLYCLTSMLSKLDMYTSHFEPALLHSTRNYYREEASRLLEQLTTTEFLIHVNTRIDQECTDRLKGYLDERSKIPLMDIMTMEMIHENIDRLLDKGFDAMMDHSEKKSLHIFYTAVSGKHRLSEDFGKLRSAFGNYIKRRGTELIQDQSKDQNMISLILTFKRDIDTICGDCFEHDAMFLYSVKESFETFINSRRTRPAELLARFMDVKLRAKKTDQDLGELIDRLFVIFRYIQEKDTFESFYKKHLSRRLLLGRNVSVCAENNIISMLKEECGAGFTKDLESMFTDMDVSRDLATDFKNFDDYPSSGDISFNVNILAQGTWPSYPTCEVILPTHMREYQASFEKYYATKFKGRRLIWQNFLGSCTMKAYFPSGVKDLSINLLQAAVLLLFNDSCTLSYTDIIAATGMDAKELKRTLLSLTSGQHQLLLKKNDNDDATTQEISPLDTFIYNSEFISSSSRLKVSVPQADPSADDYRKGSPSKALLDQQHQIEAAIVRIMKTNKKLAHDDLLHELVKQLGFAPEMADMKKRIESLIDRDYLGRDKDDVNVYLYK